MQNESRGIFEEYKAEARIPSCPDVAMTVSPSVSVDMALLNHAYLDSHDVIQQISSISYHCYVCCSSRDLKATLGSTGWAAVTQRPVVMDYFPA
jgi:hypothetical protein